jgi:hypothetical protein
MLQRTLILLLISSVLHAQQLPNATEKLPCPDEKPVPSGPGITVDQRHDYLRRDRSEDVALVLCSPELAYGGCGHQNHPPQKGIVPVSFSIDLPTGMRSWYRSRRKYLPLPSGARAEFQPKSGVLLLRLKAANSMPIGVQCLHGTLQYEIVKPGKPLITQTREVELQFTVVSHTATVAENEWPFGNRIGQHAKDVALAPLLPFQFLLFIIVCSTGSCDI